MNLLDETTVHCPYCAEAIIILVDASQGSQHYIEDCQVCCRPMEVYVHCSPEGHVQVDTCRDSD